MPAAKPAIVRLEKSPSSWSLQPEGTPTHLAALFRDPGIANERIVSVVLDRASGPDGILKAGSDCWVRGFLKELSGLPRGLTVALDNGVRCPCPRKLGFHVYYGRVACCTAKTEHWLDSLKHPDGGKPGVLLCDKDLASCFGRMGLLTREDGSFWRSPSPFVSGVGSQLSLFGQNAPAFSTMILAHPVLFSRQHAARYVAAFNEQEIPSKITRLARLEP